MDPLGISIIAALVAIGGGIAYFVARRLSGTTLAALWGLLGVVSLGLLVMANNAPGWDGFAYLIFLILGCGPIGAGMAIGSIIGCARRA